MDENCVVTSVDEDRIPGSPKRNVSISLEDLECRLGTQTIVDSATGANSKCQEGSDSGVEVNGCIMTETTPVASCDSSLISYCCSSEELISHTIQLAHDEREICGGDGTSEGGSESSSVTSTNNTRSNVTIRRKVGESRMSRINQNSTPRSRSTIKERSLSRTPLTRPSPLANKSSPSNTPPGLTRSQSVRTPADQKNHISKNIANTKMRSPHLNLPESTTSPTNRSSLSINKIKSDKKMAVNMSSSMGPVENKSNTLDKYGTLPRRRRKSAENLQFSPTDLKLTNRSPSLNRAVSMRRKQLLDNSTTPPASSKTIPPYPKKVRTKTKIYHEISIQTSLTGSDVESAIGGGVVLPDVHTRIDTKSTSVQADLRMEIIENLEAEIKNLQGKLNVLTQEKDDLERVKEEFTSEQEARRQQEQRIKLLLNGKYDGGDVVSCLEKENNFINDICKKQQIEIGQLQGLCCNLKKELDKSLHTQRKIIEQQQESEAESLEMQEFLQAEKSTLADTLKELENELAENKKALETSTSNLTKQQEECTHLVRICEQRRQENMSLETRLRAIEACSKESMLLHGAAVSGAAVALSGLGNRLEVLVDALVTSYHISQSDLEDVVFHNEAYSQSNNTSSVSSTSGDNSPQQPKKQSSQGFIAAIMNAIKAATHRSTPETYSDADLLSAEPEPSAFLGDITCNSSPVTGKRHSIASLPSLSDISPTKYSHRASISTSDDLELLDEPAVATSESAIANSESLQNLSDAILRRQKEEEQVAKEMVVRQPPSSGIVDQVIEIDNLVTKLLKVIRLIQNSKEKEREEVEEEYKVTADQVVATLNEEIVQLREKLQCNEKSTLQVETLQIMIKEKENTLEQMEKKFDLTQELLTNNWHNAMAEVRRQYDSIDSALEMLQSIEDDVKQNVVLCKLQRELEETNFHAATTLPISTTQPDLNANDAIQTRTINGTA